MHIVIITCPDLASKRLDKLFRQLIPLVEKGQIQTISAITSTDAELYTLDKANYSPSNWSRDIVAGWGGFLNNIICIKQRDLGSSNLDGILSNLPEPKASFPPRKLSAAEHSITFRHRYALDLSSKKTSQTIVLEYDACIQSIDLLCKVIDFLSTNIQVNYYIDLSDQFIPTKKHKGLAYNLDGVGFKRSGVAITRTLLAYSISPILAARLLAETKTYSLPIDMQMQVALCKLAIPGLQIANSPFVHGSKAGICTSSIQWNLSNTGKIS